MVRKPSKAQRAAGRFHLRVGQAGTAAKVYDEYSLPLFPFWMLMDAEGLLAPDAAPPPSGHCEERMSDMMQLAIAATPVRDRIPKDRPLRERLAFAIRYVREPRHDVFWMIGHATDDMMFRTAVAAVMLAGSDEDKAIIERSMRPLQALSAAMSGVPVDFGAIDMGDDLIPLMKIWHDTKP